MSNAVSGAMEAVTGWAIRMGLLVALAVLGGYGLHAASGVISGLLGSVGVAVSQAVAKPFEGMASGLPNPASSGAAPMTAGALSAAIVGELKAQGVIGAGGGAISNEVSTPVGPGSHSEGACGGTADVWNGSSG